MKHILIPTIDYFPKTGGVARYLKTMADAFPEHITVHYWDTNPPKRLRLLKELHRLSKQYDEVWTSHIYPIGFAAYLLSFFGKPYTVMLHGMDFDLARRNWIRNVFSNLILRRATNIITNTNHLAEEVRNFCGRQATVIYPTLPVAFEQCEMAEAKKNGKTLLTVGRLVKRKGHEKVIRSIQNTDVYYVIIGDGPYRGEIERLINELQLQDRVQIIADANDELLMHYYRAADIFIMTPDRIENDREGFGIVYLEASWFGVPIIASNLPGIDEAVQDNETGILISDDDDIEAAIQALLSNADERKRLGVHGHERVKQQFLAKHQMKKLEELL